MESKNVLSRFFVRKDVKRPMRLGVYGSIVASANCYNDFLCLYVADDLSAVVVENGTAKLFDTLPRARDFFDSKMRALGYVLSVEDGANGEQTFFKNSGDALAFAVRSAEANKNRRYFISSNEEADKKLSLFVEFFENEKDCTIIEWKRNIGFTDYKTGAKIEG